MRDSYAAAGLKDRQPSAKPIKSKAKSTRNRDSSPEYRCSDGHDEDDDVFVFNDLDLDPSILDSD